jgi:hypothetical protein
MKPGIENRRTLFLSIADRQMQATGGIRLADCKTRLDYAVQKRWLLKILEDNYDYEPPIIPELEAADDRELWP